MTVGTWSDGDTVFIGQQVNFDTLVGTFVVGDLVTGLSSSATGKIIQIIDDGDSSGRLTFINQTGTFTGTEDLQVDGVTIASLENTTFAHAAAVINFPAAHAVPEKRTQLVSQGGLYVTGVSLNGLRDCNALYTYLQDTFDELGAMDDTIPMSAQVKLQQYTLINDWTIPDLSFRFLESGSIQTSDLANVWTNFATLGTIAGVVDTGFLPSVIAIPQIYLEQAGSVLQQNWVGGHVDILIKVKTATIPNDATAGANVLGTFINSGTVTIFIREFSNLFDHFETTTIAGVAPIPLASSADINNANGQYSFDIADATTGWLVGEEFVDDTGETKRGIITAAIDDTQDRIEYNLTGTTQFGTGDSITGQFSGDTGTTASVPTATGFVAGLGTRIIAATVHGFLPRAAVGGGPLVDGELVTQAVTGAEAVMMIDDTTENRITFGNWNGTAWDTTNTVTGITSSATFTFTANTITTVTTIERDIGSGFGNEPYNAVIYCNRDDDAEGDTLAHMYEWIKYRTRSLETTGEEAYDLLGGKGANDTDGVQGRIYITLDTTYPLSKPSPFGTFAGGTFFGAQGVFIQNMANADIRNFQLLTAAGTLRTPPNLQTLTVQGLVTGDRVAVFRTLGAGLAIDTTEYTLTTPASTFNGSGDTIIQVDSGTISRDTPATGVVRAKQTADGLFTAYTYSSFSNPTTLVGEFIVSALPGDLDAAEDAFVPLIEEQAAGASVATNIEFLSNIPLLARVRKKGILPFEVEGSFTSSGATITAIRTTDTIVD